MNIFRSIALVLALFTAAAPAAAQWQTPNFSVPIGRGAGNTGFRNAAPGATNLPLTSNGAAADPSFRILTPGGGGTGADNSINAASDILASNGVNGNFVHVTLTSVINGVCTVSPATCASIFGYVSPLWYGAVCDGVTNDTIVLQTAITNNAGRTIFMPTKTCLATATLVMPSLTTITGGGRDVSILKSTANPALQATNVSNISLTNFQVLSTNAATSWTASKVGPILIAQDVSASVPGHDYTIQGMKFAGWNATYWIQFAAVGSLQPVSNVNVSNNYFLSDAASVPTDPDPFANTNWFIVMYSGSTGNGQYRNTVVDGNLMEATGMCFGLIMFSNHTKYRVTNNIISNPGVTSPSHCTNALTATNAYGVAIYDLNDDGNPPAKGVVSDNTITSPQASGIYVVGNGINWDLLIANNVIFNQSHSDLLLLRGGIAIAGVGGVSVVGNILKAGLSGLSIGTQPAGSIAILDNYCLSLSGGSTCLRLQAAVGAANTDIHSVRGNYFDAFGTSVSQVSATGSRFGTLDVSGNTIIGHTNSIDLSSTFMVNQLIVANNSINGGVANFASITGAQYFWGNQGLSFTAATLPAASNGSNVFVSDGAPASACTGASTGSNAFRQNGAWKCF